MSKDQSAEPEFARWDSYARFASKVRSSRRYVLEEEERTFLQTVLKTVQDREVEIMEGQLFYRAQRGVDWVERTDDDGNFIGEDVWGFSSSRMKPLTDRAREGRVNPTGIPALYVANTIETSISEVRPWVGADVSVATCKVVRPLRALDLSVGHGKTSFSGPVFRHVLNNQELSPEEKNQAVWIDIDNAFSQPVTQSDDRADYAPTQILAELFQSAGYEAIGYKSHFGDDGDRKGYNIAIFDPGAVEIVKCAPFSVKSIKVVAEQTGNPWFKKGG